jgi:hypothetical protein
MESEMNDERNVRGAAFASLMVASQLAKLENPEFHARAIALMKLQQVVDERLMALIADIEAASSVETIENV